MAEETKFSIVIEPDASQVYQTLDDLKKQEPKIKVGVDDTGIDQFRDKLKKLGLGDFEIDGIAKGLGDLGVKVSKVHSNMQEVNQEGYKLKSIILDGVGAEGEAVKVTAQYNKSKEEQLVLNVGITKELSKQAEAQKKAAKEAAKFKTEQQNALKDLVSKAKNQTKPLNAEFSKTFDSLTGQIESQLEGIGDSITDEFKNTIKNLMAEANRELKEAQNRQYAATSLRTKDVGTIKEIEHNKLDEFISKTKVAGVYTDEIEKKVESLRDQLNKVADAEGLTSYLNTFDVISSRTDALKAKSKELEKQKKAEAQALKEIAKQVKAQKRADAIAQKQADAKSKDQAETAVNKKIEGHDLGTQISKLQELGVWTGKIKEKYESLGKSLKTVGSGEELESWRKQFELLNKEAAQLLSKTSTKGGMLADKIQFADDGQIAKIKRISDVLGDVKNSVSDVLGDVKNSGAGVQSLTTQLSELKANYEKVIEALNKPNISTDKYDKYTAQLKELDKQLSKITTATTRLGDQQYMSKMDSNIQKLKSNVAAMEENWSAAWEIPELRAQLEQLKEALKSVDAVNLPNVTSEFQSLRAQVKAAGKDTKSFGGQLKSLVTEVGKYFSLYDLWQYGKQFFSAATENVKELDSAMIELKKVTDLTEQSYEKFIDTAGDRAKDIGISLVSYTEGSADFARLGYSVDDAIKLSEAANILYKVGDEIDNISNSTDAIIASMKAYGIEVAGVTGIIDKLNEVSNKTSISTGGLVEAITRSASALSVSGLSFEKSLALIVAGNETTRDASMTGTALKTLSMRIRGAQTDLKDMGEEVDEYVKSSSKMREEIKALTGVDIMINERQFKDLYDIMDELSKVYDTLSDIDRANVTEILFGKLRANVGASVLQNFDQAAKALQIAQDSAGSAMTEHARWMESITASEAKATAAFEEFSNKIVNSDVVKLYYDAKTGILGLLSGIIDKAGSAIPIVTSLGAAIASIASKGNFGISKVNMPYPTFQGAVA